MDDTARQRYLSSFANDNVSGNVDFKLSQGQREFEESRMQYLLQRFKFARPVVQNLGRIAENLTGVNRLQFSVFNEQYPTFPFLLGAHTLKGLDLPYRSGDTGKRNTGPDYELHLDSYSTEPSRFKKFDWVPFFLAYTELYDRVVTDAETRKVCLVFKRRGFAHGMCIHNDDSEQFWTQGLAWVYKFNNDGNDRRLFVQPFQNLVEGIYANGRGWKPIA